MKARLKFSKTGSMRFIGHLDVMRYFQKAFRRANISVSYSQGYSPHQLMSFASPLGIGLSSDAEYLDIILENTEDTQNILERINSVMNDEITVKDFTILQEEAKTSMAVLAGCDYMITVKPGKESFLMDPKQRKEAIQKFLQRDTIEILKKTKRSEKVVDIKEYIYYLTDNLAEFEKETGQNYSQTSLDVDEYVPVFYCQLTAGSIVNIKPELVLEALCTQENQPYDLYAYQIHRMEMYGDMNGKKGEIHTFSTEDVCKLVPLSEFDRVVTNEKMGSDIQ